MSILEIDSLSPANNCYEINQLTDLNWVFDWLIVESVRTARNTITLNHYRIYADTYAKDYSNLTKEDLMALATASKPMLEQFVEDSIDDLLLRVVNKQRFFTDTLGVIPYIPANAKEAFMDVIDPRRKRIDDSYRELVLSFRDSLMANIELSKPVKDWNSVIPVDKDLYTRYIENVENLIRNRYKERNIYDTISVSKQLKFMEVVDVVKSMLLMTRGKHCPASQFYGQDLLDIFVRGIIQKDFKAIDYVVYPLSYLRVEEAVCLRPNSTTNLPTNLEGCSRQSDSYRLFMSMILSELINKKFMKDDKRNEDWRFYSFGWRLDEYRRHFDVYRHVDETTGELSPRVGY